MTNIGLVSYVNPLVARGGGELFLGALLSAAPKEVSVEVTALWPTPTGLGNQARDAWIVADLGNLPSRQRRVDQRLLTKLPYTAAWKFQRRTRQALSGRYVHLDNAYVDVCNLPYLPCGGTKEFDDCPFQAQPCHSKQTEALYANAAGCYFVSPLHAATVATLQPVAKSKTRVIGPVLDTSRFIDARQSNRDIDRLFVGSAHPAKGIDRLQDDENLVVVSNDARAPGYFQRARVVSGVDARGVADYFGRAKRFEFSPRWPEPFGRVVAEAALAGCELAIDGDLGVGALSFNLDLSDPEVYEDSAALFWESVREDLGC